MGFDPSLRKKVRMLAKEEVDRLSEEEIYSSPELKAYFENLSITMEEERKRPNTITLFRGERDGDIAWTNGNEININWNNGIVWYYQTPEQRFVAISGLFFHEMAHDLFLDFNEERRAIKFLEDGRFYGRLPENLTADEEADLDDMKTALSDESIRPVFMQVFHELANNVDDTHDENSLIDVYGSFVGEGISLCASALHAKASLFEDMKKKAAKGGLSDLTIAFNLILQLTRYGYVLCKNQDALDKSVFGPILKKIEPHAVIACASDDVQRRFTELNYIMLTLWPFIRAEIQRMEKQKQAGQSGSQGQQSQNQGQNSQQSNGQGQSNQQTSAQANNQGQNGSQQTPSNVSAETIKEILKQISEAAEQAGKTADPQKKNSSNTAVERRSAERKGEKKPEQNGQGNKPGKEKNEAIYNALKNIKEQIAESKAEATLEKEAKQKTIDAVTTVDQTSPHKNVPLTFTRNLNVSESDKTKYESLMRDLSGISKRLQRQIIDALRDLKEGFVSKHKLTGKMLVVNDAYRPDGRCFANKKIPQDLPDMAISVLVDHSGSMSGTRIETAMKASMLLYDFATGIDIPISISGHRTNGGTVEFINYTDFEKISDRDRYRLSKMSACGCNRDGMGLNIAAGLLAKRPEQVKLLIIISDGRPNHDRYGGTAAAEDIQEIIRNCRRKGIEVIAAAIGDDKANIQAIYKEEFLDISDLSKLPRIMTNIVKKRVLRTAF